MEKGMFSVFFALLLAIALTATALAQEVSPQLTAVWSDKDAYKVGEEVTIYANVKNADGSPFIVEEGKNMVTFGLLGLGEKETAHTKMAYDTKSMYYVGKAPAPNKKEVRAWVNVYYGLVNNTWTGLVMHNTYTFKVIDATETVVAPKVSKVYIADVWSDKPYYKVGEPVTVYAKVMDENGEPASPEKGYSVSGNIRNFGKDPVRGLFFAFNSETAYWEAKERIPQEISSPVNVFVEARLIINGEQVASAENTDFYFKVEGVEQGEVIEPVERPEVVTNPCAKLWTECRARVTKELGYVEGEVRTGEEEVKLRIKISEECSLIQQKCIEERCVPIEKYKACIKELSAAEFLEKYEYENKCGIPCPEVAPSVEETDKVKDACTDKLFARYPELYSEIEEECDIKSYMEIAKKQYPDSTVKQEFKVYALMFDCTKGLLPQISKDKRFSEEAREEIRAIIEDCQVEELPGVIEKVPKRAEKATGFLNCFSKVLKTELTEEEVGKIYKEAEMICKEPKESLGASVSCVVRVLKGYPEIKKKVLMECAPYVAEEEATISETMGEAVPEGYGMRDIFCQGCRQDSKCMPYGTRLKISKPGEAGGCKEECFECKGGCETDQETGLEVCYEPPKECLEKEAKYGEKICKMICSEQLLVEELEGKQARISEEVPMYCSIDGTFKPQVAEGEECQNSYECLSNECSNGTCVSTYGLLQKIWAWLTRLFKIGE